MTVTRTLFLVTISKIFWYLDWPLRRLTTKQEYVQLQNNIKTVRTSQLFVYKNHFFREFFSSFNLNLDYGNQRRLFSDNLPGMFQISESERDNLLSVLSCFYDFAILYALLAVFVFFFNFYSF